MAAPGATCTRRSSTNMSAVAASSALSLLTRTSQLFQTGSLTSTQINSKPHVFNDLTQVKNRSQGRAGELRT
jgi:hypothetical protein